MSARIVRAWETKMKGAGFLRLLYHPIFSLLAFLAVTLIPSAGASNRVLPSIQF
jgi:hypothetical protein